MKLNTPQMMLYLFTLYIFICAFNSVTALDSGYWILIYFAIKDLIDTW